MAKKTQAIMKYDEELAKYAQEASDKEATPAGNFIKVRAGVLMVAGQPVENNELNVVVIGHIYENCFYKDDFDDENPASPDCYAYGTEEEGMKPHPDAPAPQNETCEGCPMNEWGSSPKGKGKWCKNTRRLALISGDGLDPAGAAEGEVLYYKPPVTSVKGWSLYVKGLASNLKRPPFSMITQMKVVPDPKVQFRVMFKPVEPVPPETLPALLKRHEEVMKDIEFPYSARSAEDETPRSKAAKNKAAKKQKQAPKPVPAKPKRKF